MSAPVSAKLIQDDTGAYFIVEGNPTSEYDLFRCVLAPCGHFKRSWQAVREAMGEAES